MQHGAAIKEMPVSVSKGVATVHHITWTDPPAAPVEKGHLSVGTDPVGGIVIVDGVTRGAAPLTLRDLPVGAHRAVVRARGTTYTRTVQIEAGTTASLFFEGSQAVAVAPGSIAIESRVPVQVFEDKRLVGTSQMDRIILPAGEHALEFVADSVGFRSTHTVHVAAGETTAIPVELPRTNVSIMPCRGRKSSSTGYASAKRHSATCSRRSARTRSCSVIPNLASVVCTSL